MAKFTLAKALALASMMGVVLAQDIAPCAAVCVTDALRGPEVGCAAGAMDCICPSPALANVLAECVRRSCAGAVENVEDAVGAASGSAQAVCATATLPAPTPAATTPPPAAESTPAPEENQTTTPAASTTERPTPEQAPQSSATDSSSSSSTDVAAASTSSTQSSSSTALPTPASDSSSSQDGEDDSDSSAPAGGLSTGAKAGIGISVGAVALALIGTAVWLFLRRRAAKSPASSPYNISGPMPGGGRDFGDSGSDFHRDGRAPMAESDFSARRLRD
ncbi:uncharacterized protein DNG_09818 [Cephalotrichum gorgonifer]|uniref:CFEM domain-containing protein n=1 Tax=Cephalotrichum gorgonifer TaxID=2041049 RepID=A0AAE8SZN1_9PEZI|nr:uncharacterized protein DNG_09818 [Cephalotrichum gorgonifer]